jgi:phosphoribosylformylglycinamidine cyclo-ligase
MSGRHRSIAGDLVRHCVNDILVQGAKPLLFLDYFATGKLDANVAEEVVAGMSDACRDTKTVLIGGETAEMPGMYSAGEYDLAGTIIGIVDKYKIVDGSHVQIGDVIIGLTSDGLHTNGYSLARHVLLDSGKVRLDDKVLETNTFYLDALTAQHRCYATPILKLLNQFGKDITGMAHITGGGLVENIPRTLPEGLAAKIDQSTWQVPAIFKAIQEIGNVPQSEMMRTFNMGIGYVIIVHQNVASQIQHILTQEAENAIIIGTVIAGEGVIFD